MISTELQKKIDKAIKIIRMAAGKNIIEVCFSGGKDSEVILELTKMAGVKYRAIYKNTTIDPPGTISHCMKKGVEIMRPKKTFLELIRSSGMPTRRARFCCDKLKEYKVLDIAVQGIRCSESVARAERYDPDDPIKCRFYGSKKNHVNVAYPILDWTENDVRDFILARGIKCHHLYYDSEGNFHVERRLGCVGCPLQSDNGVSDFLKNPKLFKQIVKATKDWFDTHTHTKSHAKFGTVYGLIAHNLFYKTYNDWFIAENNMFEKIDWKKKLEDYFRIELP